MGRLTRQKGVEDLLLALRRLEPGLLGVTPVRIVGDGPERRHLEEVARSIDGADVTFLGQRSSEEVADPVDDGGNLSFCRSNFFIFLIVRISKAFSWFLSHFNKKRKFCFNFRNPFSIK